LRGSFGSQLRGYLWTRNCVATYGLAIAWLPLDSQLRGYLWTRNCMATFELAIAWLPLDSQLRGLYLKNLSL